MDVNGTTAVLAPERRGRMGDVVRTKGTYLCSGIVTKLPCSSPGA
jgi:hypothetical protein